jgi:hypothetical protein
MDIQYNILLDAGIHEVIMSANLPSELFYMDGRELEPPLLEQLRFHFTQRALATRLDVNP